MHRVLALLATTSLIGGCAKPDHIHRWPTSSVLSAGPRPGFAIKIVVYKQEPVVLVADESVCRTSEKRFTSTAVGKWFACSWQLPAPNA